jgi:ACT domain-containing protein
MLEIRKRVIDGESYEDIQQQLGLSKRTFYRYLQNVFKEDKKVLEIQNVDEVKTQVAILRERYNQIYRNLHGIATNEQNKPSERMEALQGMAAVSKLIVSMHKDAPVALINHERKLSAIKKEGLTFTVEDEKLRLLPATNYLPNRYHDYCDSADTNTYESNKDDENVDTVKGGSGYRDK